MLRIALALTVLFVAPAALVQQAHAPASPPVGPDWTKVNVTTTDLGNRTYMLSNGMSGNVTIAVGDDGIIMVDAQHAPMHEKLKAAIAAVSPQPVKFLINTHIHGDHTGGNLPFAKDGVTIVAHENVKKRLAAGTTSNISGQPNPPVAAEALPGRTYAGDSTSVEVKGRVAQLKHHPRAHTDGDTYIYFADANVLSTGDTFNNGRYQNADWVNGGNLKGMIAVADAYLAIGASLDRPELNGRAWNAGWGKPIPVIDLVRTLIEVSGREVEPDVRGQGTPHGEIDRQYLDSTAIREQLGWEPQWGIERGLAAAWEWYERRCS